ncbi:MAG: DUF2336 domain-containing protein [Aestuariivirga sp.]|uniref:DUF2336 domain-containing protein n=1 Tax=Aestuariivirga sp. TaxID=2650926 RepID=UPI00301588D8
MATQEEPMPLDAPNTAGEPAPSRGTADSFRMLTARLKRQAPPKPHLVHAEAEEVPPPPVAEAAAPLGPRESAATLLDIIWGAVDLPPQERSMAGDALLLLLPRLPAKDLAMLAERIAAMEQPPPLLVARLLRDARPEIGGVVLERSAHLDDADILAACRDGDPERLRLLARRRSVPPALSDFIVQSGDLLSRLMLLRNPGAQVSFQSFLRLSQMAGEHPGLQAPLALRTDLPLAVALDLIWRLPTELRRVIIARFLSDSVNLGRILSIAYAAGDGPALREGAVAPAEADAAFGPLLAGKRDLTVSCVAQLAGIAEGTVERIFSDGEGEALVALLKALGLSRAHFDEVLERLRASSGLLREGRPPEEFKAVFDALSFTKARVLLIYWDWFTRKAGPYAAPDDAGLVEPAPLA